MRKYIVLGLIILIICCIIVLAQNVGVDGSGNFYCKQANGSACTYPSSGGGIPSGLVVITLTSCPTGFTESAALNGKMLRGTVVANGDVGTTGGNATITPAGTISAPVFTGSSGTTSAVTAGTPAGTIAWPASVPTFTGSALGTHTHTFTGSVTTASATTTTPKLVTANTSTGVAEQITAAGTNASVSAGTPVGTIAYPASVPSFTGSALATHTHTLTPAGTNSVPTFTGNAIDPSPLYTKVIFCQAN